MASSATPIAGLARGALGAAGLSLAATLACGQSTTVQVGGSLSGSSSDNSQIQIGFSCTGIPTCTGVFGAVIKDRGCTNSLAHGGPITVTGLDLGRTGALQGGIALVDQVDTISNADGSCSTGTRSNVKTISATYTASWDGTLGTMTVQGTDDSGQAFTLSGSFAATGIAPPPPPAFPMTVSSNITPQTATVAVQFQPRPEDVGKTEGVFVFAHAPASKVPGAKRAEGPGAPIRRVDGGDPCVLASVNPAGQLSAASASSLSPALTTVLTAQGQALSLLNNASTPAVAGATVFAGYGQDANSMLSGGVYQGAATVPGTVTCGTTLNAQVLPKSPGALSGLWYNASESGWGIYFASRGAKTFVAWYTYDTAGAPKWYVSDNCAMAPGATGTSGACIGTLYEVRGPAFFGVPFDASRKQVTPVGTLQVGFADAGHASMTYNVAGQARTVAITRQPISSTAPVAVDFTDLWFDPSENGWGMAVAQQFDKMFLAWFVYDAAGNPVWYVGPDCTVSGNSCSGSLYRTTGPPFGPTFSGTVTPILVGTVKLDFTGPNDGTVTYTVDGVSGVKPIQRQVF